MIIVIGRVEYDPAATERLQPALDAMMRATWAESGCLSYSIAIESRSEGVATVVERWKSEADMRAHLESPHMALFNDAIADAVRGMDVKIYDVANERTLAL
jgi:quinol monooxygenase YgiN